MEIKERALKQRKNIVAHRAADFKDAEGWDLDFLQTQTPEDRLSALVAIRRHIMKFNQSLKQTGSCVTDES